MSHTPEPAEPPIELVIPDCCNIGVVFRVLIMVNLTVLMATLLRTSGFRVGLQDFVEASMLVELICLSSLVALCGVRRAMRTMPLWGQRAICGLLPAGVTFFIIYLLSMNLWFLDSFTHLAMFEGMVAAGLFGITLQHYFELRTRAYSPALVEARLQALQARIRPHFLFNSLNAVLSLIRSEPKRAETTLEDLADLFRVLMRDARDMTTLEQEIRLCRQYLSIEKVRLGDRLQVKWEAVNVSDSVLNNAQIPSLLLQPLLENAVHYGVEPATETALIKVKLTRSLDRIEISVTNPYYGNDAASEGNHMALDNIRERLALLYDVEAQITTSTADGVFEVKLRFPYVKGD